MKDIREGQVLGEEGTGRRRLLKALAAAGGAAAATALVPGSWKKPVAAVGSLPAHAQVSGTPPVLTNLVVRRYAGNAPVGNGFTHQASFDFEDQLDGVTKASLITAVIGPPTPGGAVGFPSCPPPVPEPGKSLTQLGAMRKGDSGEGAISFPFAVTCSVSSFSLCVTLEAQGRKSDPVCAEFNPNTSTAP